MTIAQEARRRNSGDVMILLAEITHPDQPLPVRVARNGANVTSNGDLFEAYPYEFVHESQGEDDSAAASIVIDNLHGGLLRVMRASAVAPRISLWIVMASAPNARELIMDDMEIRGVAYDLETIRGMIPKPQFLTEPAPHLRFVPSAAPGLFE